MFQSKLAEWSYSLGFISAAVDLSTGSWTTQNVVGYPREDVKVLGVVSVWFSVLAALPRMYGRDIEPVTTQLR
jgi:hypothetical protein